MRIRCEYRCVSQKDEVVAQGEFTRDIYDYHIITNPNLQKDCIFAVMHHARFALADYKGDNHLKSIQLKVTNVFTGNVRCFGGWED